MRASVHYLFLLLFALPALASQYHISGFKGCIVSTGKEKPGYPVITAGYGDGCPSNTIVNVHSQMPVLKAATYGPVSGKSGLYIGRSKDGKHLEWAKKPYEWKFLHSPHPGFFSVRAPTSKHDEFWFEAGNKKAVKLVDLSKGYPLWSFHEVDA